MDWLGSPLRRLRDELLHPVGHPRCFHDGYRAARSLVIGSVISIVLLRRLALDEAISLGLLSAMLIDLLIMIYAAHHLTAAATRKIFGRWHANRTLLIERAVLLAFISIGVLSLCVHDIHGKTSTLPPWTRILVYFAALFTTWMQLHIGFSFYYAKHYYQLNPLPSADGPNPQGFVFAGSDEPVFSDFLYIAFAVGLTYAMSDVNLEDFRLRRTVLLHSVVSFLFYSTVISAILNLMTTA